jgi:hypothetical protein
MVSGGPKFLERFDECSTARKQTIGATIGYQVWGQAK